MNCGHLYIFLLGAGDEIYRWMFSELGTNPSEWQEILAACNLNISNPLEVCSLPHRVSVAKTRLGTHSSYVAGSCQTILQRRFAD